MIFTPFNFNVGGIARAMSNSSFSRMITLLRKEKKITQKKAASDLGISQALLSHYEKGIRECGLNFLVRCADYYDVSCDYLLGRSPEPSGQTLTVEEIPAPDKLASDHRMNGSILATLNKKLISNSLNVLYDLLVRSGNNELLQLTSDCLFLQIYTLFRSLYETGGHNNSELFGISQELYRELVPAAMLRDQAYLNAQFHNKNAVNTERLALSSEILARNYPLFASSLLNLLKNAELSLNSLTK